MNNFLQGVFTAIVTPFIKDKIDFTSFGKLITKQIDANIDGIVIAGSTGEGNNLTDEEYLALVKYAISHAQDRAKIIATISGVATAMAIKKIRSLSGLKIDALMCTVPHYIRPEQEGIYQHFLQLSENSDLPIIMYIHPGRTGVSVDDDTIIALSKLPKVIAVKDATSDMVKPLRLGVKTSEEFAFLCGDDVNLLSYMANGGDGVISVLSNFAPHTCKKLFSYCVSGDFAKARALQRRLLPVLDSMFQETNPISVKYFCKLLHGCTPEVRLPLTTAKVKTHAAIEISAELLVKLEKEMASE